MCIAHVTQTVRHYLYCDSGVLQTLPHSPPWSTENLHYSNSGRNFGKGEQKHRAGKRNWCNDFRIMIGYKNMLVSLVSRRTLRLQKTFSFLGRGAPSNPSLLLPPVNFPLLEVNM